MKTALRPCIWRRRLARPLPWWRSCCWRERMRRTQKARSLGISDDSPLKGTDAYWSLYEGRNDPVILRRTGWGRSRNEPGGSRQGLKLPVFLANHDDCAGAMDDCADAVVGELKGDRFRPAQACGVKQGDSGVVAESGRRGGGLRERMRRTQKARPLGIWSPTTLLSTEPVPVGGLTRRASNRFPLHEQDREGTVKTPDGVGRIHLCPMIGMPVAGSPIQNRKH